MLDKKFIKIVKFCFRVLILGLMTRFLQFLLMSAAHSPYLVF